MGKSVRIVVVGLGYVGLPLAVALARKFEATGFDIDPRRMEPKLSIKQQAEDEERRAHREYRKQLAKDSGFGTLGDLLAKLK